MKVFNGGFSAEDNAICLEVLWGAAGEARKIVSIKGNQSDCAFIFYRDGKETQRLWLTDIALNAMISLKKCSDEIEGVASESVDYKVEENENHS